MKEIKTKPAIKDIKMLDKTKVVSRKLKNSYIRAKKQTEQTEYNDENYVNDAGNSMRVGTEAVARKVSFTVGHYCKKVTERVKASVKRSVFPPRARKETKDKISYKLDVRAARQPPDTFCKSVCNIKHVETDNKTIRKAAKGNITRAQKSIKNIEYIAKNTIRASQTTVKTVAKTTIKSPQVAKRAEQVIRVATRMTATSIRMAPKAIVVTIKATIVFVKSLITMIIAGGTISVVVIIIICLTGFLTGSVYGIFLTNENSSPNAPIMREVISQLNKEFSAKINEIQHDNPHDALELTGNRSGIVNNWPGILAVYAVKVSVSPENGMNVATLDDKKVSILRSIFWDMNQIKHTLEIIDNKETKTTTDMNDKEKAIPLTKTILHIDVTSKSYLSMIEQYGFNAQQVKMLNELMEDENKQLFMQLIGG